MPNGKDILKTLIELLEAQENIKVTYEIGGKSNGAVQPPKRGSTNDSQ